MYLTVWSLNVIQKWNSHGFVVQKDGVIRRYMSPMLAYHLTDE